MVRGTVTHSRAERLKACHRCFTATRKASRCSFNHPRGSLMSDHQPDLSRRNLDVLLGDRLLHVDRGDAAQEKGIG